MSANDQQFSALTKSSADSGPAPVLDAHAEVERMIAAGEPDDGSYIAISPDGRITIIGGLQAAYYHVRSQWGDHSPAFFVIYRIASYLRYPGKKE